MNTKNCPPVVSVVMPAYNSERYIAEAVESVQKQTFHEWELLIIDDGSTDRTIEIAKEKAEEDRRIHVYENTRNQGVAATRNRGISLASGQYIALLDSDDIWKDEKLERQLQIAKDDDVGIIYSSYALIGSSGEKAGNDFVVPENITFRQMLANNYIGCSTVMIKRSIAAEHPFSTEFYHEDYALWLSLLEAGVKAAGAPEVLVLYRVHAGSKAYNKTKAAKNRWMIYRKHMHFSRAKSAWFLFHYMIAGLKKYRGIRTER